MHQQPEKAQKGEIEFRKKLVGQQINGVSAIDDEYDTDSIERILHERMETTLALMSALRANGITVSPYVEIGAERCQRSLIMENDIGAAGAAADLSFDMLKSCDHYKKVFKKDKTPLRICCDVYNLPFKTDSIPIVFCYATLLQFPDPFPITKQVYRVLAPGGCFSFNEEPYKKVMHLNLYKGEKKYSERARNRSTLKKAIDFFLSKEHCNEDDHGIISNLDLSTRQWKRALSFFDENAVMLHSLRRFHTDLFRPSSRLSYFLAYLLGGNIDGVCRKKGVYPSGAASIAETVICPSCKETGAEVVVAAGSDRSVTCPVCARRYPNKEGVLFLFSYSKFRELYPGIFDEFGLKRE